VAEAAKAALTQTSIWQYQSSIPCNLTSII